jgi:2'-5' RNA ligase
MALSLWLMPDSDVYERFSRLIADLAGRHGGPRFEPHVTLLGRVLGEAGAIMAALETRLSSLPPLAIRLQRPQYEDSYFRCLFVEVERTPALLEAHRRAAEGLDQAADTNFRPHLSLLYGHLPVETKRAIVRDLASQLDITFTADAIDVVRTDGEPERWHRVGRVALATDPGP